MNFRIVRRLLRWRVISATIGLLRRPFTCGLLLADSAYRGQASALLTRPRRQHTASAVVKSKFAENHPIDWAIKLDYYQPLFFRELF